MADNMKKLQLDDLEEVSGGIHPDQVVAVVKALKIGQKVNTLKYVADKKTDASTLLSNGVNAPDSTNLLQQSDDQNGNPAGGLLFSGGNTDMMA